MGTKTKQVTDVATLGNYTLYGSSTNPVNETTLAEEPVGSASIDITITGNGAALALNQTIIDLTGPNSGDQKLRIVLRSDGTEPTAPDETTLLDVNVDSADTVNQVATALNTALAASNAIFSSSVTTSVVTFSPQCGGTWTSSITGSSATVSITDGVGFGTSTMVTQNGAGVELTNTSGNGAFNQLRLEIDGVLYTFFGPLAENGTRDFRNSTGTNVGQLVANGTSGSVGNALYSLTQRNFSTRASTANSTDATVLAQMVTDMTVAINAEFLGNGIDLVAVNTDANIIFYSSDTTDLTAPTCLINFTNGNWAASTTTDTRMVSAFTATPDPHVSSSVSQVRFFDPNVLESALGRVAPNYVFFGENSTWTMDNFSMNFDAGFRFVNGHADSSTQNFEQVNITKSGDGQGGQSFNGSTNGSMYETGTTITLNFSNCTLAFYPVIGGGVEDSLNILTSFLSGTTANIILQWDEVFLRYSGNSQCDLQLSFDGENSSITNSGVVADGTAGSFRTLIGIFDKIRLVEPFRFIGQSANLTFFFNSVSANQTESFTNSDFFASSQLVGPNIDEDTIVRPFQNRDSFFKFLDFIVGDGIYTNVASYSNVSYTSSRLQTGNINYGISFDPQYFQADGSDLSTVRNEFRYGDSTENDPLRVKEMFETGPIGGSAATIALIELSDNLTAGTVITVPRPNGLDKVTIEEATTPVSSGNVVQFALGSTSIETTSNIEEAIRDAQVGNDLQIWFLRGFNGNFRNNFCIGNSVGGTATAISCDDTTNTSVTSLQTGAGGSGTFTHPFNAGVEYIDSTEGLLNTNTLSDNRYEANTSTSVGVGNNNGQFLGYTKSNYLNDTGSGSGSQGDIPAFSDDYTVYTKRPAYRPEITSFKFSDGPQLFSKILVADIHWEGVAKSVVDAYTRTDIDDMNDLYRWVENETDDRTITNQDDLTSVYDRFISLSSPVDSGALIDFEDLNLILNTTGTNPSYNSATTTLTLPIQSSIDTGGTILGIKTNGNVTISNDIDLNDVILEVGGTLTTSGVSITNGILRASTITATASDFTSTQIEVPTGETVYTVNHSGGNFDSVTMASGGTLNTDDASLHGLTADNITINYEGTTADFSVDSPGAITNSTINFDDITQNIDFNIDEDLGDCDLVNSTTFTITLVLGDNGVLPNSGDGGSLTGLFVISRTINVGLDTGDTVNYIIANATTDAIITNSTFTATSAIKNIPFSSTFAVDVFVKQTTATAYLNRPILILNNTDQDIIRSFEAETQLNAAIQSDAANRQIVDDYVAAITIDIDSGDDKMANFVCPDTFTSGGVTQNPNDTTYWDPRGERGAGQYAIKILEEDSDYGLLVLANKSALSETQPQLFTLGAANSVNFITANIQLHSKTSVTVISFFPAQFTPGAGVTIGIVGSPNGLVDVYGAANVVIITNDTLNFVTELMSNELNERIVTKENVENLGLLIPANPDSEQ